MRPLLSAIGLSRLAPGDIDFAPGPGPRRSSCPALGQGRLPALLRDHLFRRSGRPRQPARFHLQSFERRLVRQLGPAAASRPGAAARGRGGHAGDPLDPDRDQRGDRCARPRRPIAAVAHRRRDRCRTAAAGASPTPFARFGNVIPLALGFLLLIAAIALGRSRRYRPTHKDFLISNRTAFSRLCAATTSSPPNPFPKAIPTRSPTRSPTPSSTVSRPRTPKRASPAKRWSPPSASSSPAKSAAAGV